jgi:hypothetical protein
LKSDQGVSAVREDNSKPQKYDLDRNCLWNSGNSSHQIRNIPSGDFIDLSALNSKLAKTYTENSSFNNAANSKKKRSNLSQNLAQKKS